MIEDATGRTQPLKRRQQRNSRPLAAQHKKASRQNIVRRLRSQQRLKMSGDYLQEIHGPRAQRGCKTIRISGCLIGRNHKRAAMRQRRKNGSESQIGRKCRNDSVAQSVIELETVNQSVEVGSGGAVRNRNRFGRAGRAGGEDNIGDLIGLRL